ncbi:MAG: hypothetical protein ABFC84_18735 [Veillonellales bacterium]
MTEYDVTISSEEQFVLQALDSIVNKVDQEYNKKEHVSLSDLNGRLKMDEVMVLNSASNQPKKLSKAI